MPYCIITLLHITIDWLIAIIALFRYRIAATPDAIDITRLHSQPPVLAADAPADIDSWWAIFINYWHCHIDISWCHYAIFHWLLHITTDYYCIYITKYRDCIWATLAVE